MILTFFFVDFQNMQQKTMPDNEIDKIKRTLDEERMKKIQVNVFIVTVLSLVWNKKRRYLICCAHHVLE